MGCVFENEDFLRQLMTGNVSEARESIKNATDDELKTLLEVIFNYKRFCGENKHCSDLTDIIAKKSKKVRKIKKKKFVTLLLSHLGSRGTLQKLLSCVLLKLYEESVFRVYAAEEE